MELRAYLTEQKIGPTAFAKRLGVSHVTILRYLNGERRPEWPMVERIEQETGGTVTRRDLWPDRYPDPTPSDRAA